MTEPPPPSRFPLHRPADEHDGCGVGFVADVDGQMRDDIIDRALEALRRLSHRGAAGADTRTSDGSGLLFRLPRRFFRRWLAESTDRPPAGPVGVGVVFWPRAAPDIQRRGRRHFSDILKARGIDHFAFRTIPVAPEVLGINAAESRPHIEQLVVGFDADSAVPDVERQLYAMRRQFESVAGDAGIDAYIASMSAKTIVYKGLVMADELHRFYPDLQRPWATNFAVFHQRFSTNTLPSWKLAQPFRRLGHNGEINTIYGNANNTAMREEQLDADIWRGELDYIRPVLQRGFSDSALLDNVVELLNLSGRSMAHVVQMLIPRAWQHDGDLSEKVRAFFEYHACLNEPWDGPAAVIYADGDMVGAHLDRNGLRPLRYQVTADGLMCAGSEVGILDIGAGHIVERDRLGPGQMLAIDLQAGKRLDGERVTALLADRSSYGDWLDDRLQRIGRTSPDGDVGATTDGDELTRRQLAFGYSREEIKFLFGAMTESGGQPISSMGDDTPISVLSKLPRLLPTYFKQRFAQVTNPPIDPIRESSVMSLAIRLGRRHNWLAEGPEHADKIELAGPVLTDGGLQHIREVADGRLQQLDCTFGVADGSTAMVDALHRLTRRAEAAVDDGNELLVLSDRGIGEHRAPIPMLLAVGAVSSHLLRVGKRLQASIICVSGEPRDVHQFATLIGYGAGAVVPYLAIETIVDQCEGDSQRAGCDVDNFIDSIEHGLLKIMSKMGISDLSSYRGAQIFEAIGIGREVIDECFPHTPSPIGGIGFSHLTQEAARRHLRAFGPDTPGRLEDLGYYRFRRGGERHAWAPKLLGSMNKFRRGKEGAYDDFSTAAADNDGPLHLRDLVEFNAPGEPIEVDEVESADAIRRRFTTAAMSLGALSPEAHEALAIAMNRIGGKSNSGEGGEDPARYRLRENGDNAESAIKQIASGRFGVTPQYVARAQELEIKMAQGSKPGEGGQLPGHKVTDYIAVLRHSTPGVALISPPPHHDIYSIEDLAQLIYDLKSINTDADVCVKLVAESGVGTIAAGVAKADADVILISGHEGGTGASPLSSIKNAGNAWEIGLAETQQVLRNNGLRERVKLRVDGGLKTGRDIVVAAMMGAEEFNFGTAALISLGCRYVRQCHLDTCPVGIATQREDLRQKFSGDPANVVSYFNAVANEIRHILAGLGARSLDEIIGRTDLLRPRTLEHHPKAASLDVSPLIAPPEPEDGPTLSTWPRNARPGPSLNDRIVDDVHAWAGADRKFRGHYDITNGDRTVGAKLAGLVATGDIEVGDEPDGDCIRLHFSGTAGQSFGAFAATGMTLELDGEANDYVAKGLGGGRVIINGSRLGRANRDSDDILAGNTVLYGATGGELYVRGRVGERFAVRNSGAVAVVEGTGDHGCEYMTSGTVVILGETGHNFGAGMTGGTAFVYDRNSRLPDRRHPDFAVLRPITAGDDGATRLQALIETHLRWTGSQRARDILANFNAELEHFWRVIPRAIVERRSRTAIHRVH